MQPKNEMPIYMRIAVDLAGRIHKGEFADKPRLRGRSALASEYNVSPETVRRAIRILEDTQIVRVVHGSGIYIQENSNVEAFIQRFKIKETLLDYKEKLADLMEEKEKIDSQVRQIIEDIIDYSDRLKNSGQILPQEIQLPPNSSFEGKCVQELSIWQNTGATVAAIKRAGEMLVSPGPYAVFQPKDRVVVVGGTDAVQRMIAYMQQEPREEND
ncbi:TrkA C-terminal domain-containing protein [Anaerotalea alkaliphila]|uniref:GntR family transcriptional regulator n=1 Tax=Anaerotalea alkaliphila TaxID=2662126 RepID=A0A7X5HU00_9FIRM|nr:TrkA C-terminal domain-containing protein [Anaerotalea alkaliphila]NDL66636.1 GntR family transcriptional regulator [Anaerotalea alkaliphila]